MKMWLRMVLLIAVLLVLAATQATFAKEAHARHGVRAGAANNGTSGKGASGAHGAGGAKPTATKATVPIVNETVAPPVLPPQGATPQSNRNIHPTIKIAPPGNQARTLQSGVTIAPTMHNAIGQPIITPKNFSGAQPGAQPALQLTASPPRRLYGAAPAAPPIARSNATHANMPAVSVATVANRGSVSGAGLIRPAAAPTAIGGAARPTYGINGTSVQNKH